MMSMVKRFLLLGPLAGAVLPVHPQSDQGRWASRAPWTDQRGECAGAVLGDRIYVGGGGPSQGGVRAMYAYSPADDSWERSVDMPVGLHHNHIASHGGKLYLLGGCDHPRQAPDPFGVPWIGSPHAHEFDPATGRWRALRPLPRASGMGGSVSFGKKLYVIGGVDDRGVTLDLVQEYDPATDTWRERAPMPTAREHLGIAVLDSLIYVVAGRPRGFGGQSLANFEAYSPASDTWYVLDSLPTKRSGLALAAAKGRLYAMGGEWPGVHRTNEEYNPATRKWRRVMDMPVARHGFVAASWGDRIYAMGFNPQTSVFDPPGGPIFVRRADRRMADAGSMGEWPFFDIRGRRTSGQSRLPVFRSERKAPTAEAGG